VLTIDDLRSDRNATGLKYVAQSKGGSDGKGGGTTGNRFFAQVGQPHGSPGSFRGPRRATAEEAAQDAVNYLNGVAVEREAKRPPTLDDLYAAARETARPRKTRRVRGGKRKTVRDKRQRTLALARADGVCEFSLVPYPYGLDVHHVRTDVECEAEGLLWDSPENVIAVRPDWHRAAHASAKVYGLMKDAIDNIERPSVYAARRRVVGEV